MYFSWLLLLGVIFGATSATYTSCPYGWVLGPDAHCYLFSKSQVSWYEAAFICEQKKGHLAQVNHAGELKFLKECAIKLNAGDYWLGGTDQFAEKKWVWWPSRAPVNSYVRDWSPNNPDNHRGIQHCMLLWKSSSYRWDDQGCRNLRYYVCETYPGSDKICQCKSSG